MWPLLHKLRCASSSALLYFHKIKLNFVLRSHSTRLTEIQFLSLLRSSPAHAKLPGKHLGRSLPLPSAHTDYFWVSHCPDLLGLESCGSGDFWSSGLTFLGDPGGQSPHPLPRGILSPSWRYNSGACHRSPYRQNPGLHFFSSFYPTLLLLPYFLSDTLMSYNNLPCCSSQNVSKTELQSWISSGYFSLTTGHLSKEDEN